MDIHQALKILNLSPQVAQKEIKQAYRAMAKEWHPDRFLDPDEKSKAEEKIKEINQAYTLLKNYTGTVENNDTSPSDRASSEQKASIRNKSRDPDSWYQIACDYYQKGQSSEAIEACTQAIRLNKDYLEAYQLRCEILTELGYENRAKSDRRNIIEVERKLLNKQSQTDRSSHYPGSVRSHKTHSPNSSSSDSLDSDDPEFFYHRAQIKQRNGKPLGAIEDCSIAINLNPDYLEAYQLRRSLYLKIGNQKQAVQETKVITALQEKRRTEKNSQSVAASPPQTKETEKPLKTSEPNNQTIDPVENHENSSFDKPDEAFYRLALHAFHGNNLQEALNKCNKAIRLNPDYLEAYQLRRTICIRLSYLDRANFDTKQINRIKLKNEPSSP